MKGALLIPFFLVQDRAAAINILDELELDELSVVPSDEFYFSKIRPELHPFYLAHTFSSKCLLFFVDPRGVQYLWYLNQSIGYYVVSKCLSNYIGGGQRGRRPPVAPTRRQKANDRSKLRWPRPHPMQDWKRMGSNTHSRKIWEQVVVVNQTTSDRARRRRRSRVLGGGAH